MSSGIFTYRRIIRFTVCRVNAIPREWFYDTLERAKAAAGDEDVVCLTTGHLLKDPDAAAAAGGDSEPVPADADAVLDHLGTNG